MKGRHIYSKKKEMGLERVSPQIIADCDLLVEIPIDFSQKLMAFSRRRASALFAVCIYAIQDLVERHAILEDLHFGRGG